MARGYEFEWGIAVKAMNSYMSEFGLAPHVLVVIDPQGEETISVSDVFTLFPQGTMYWALREAKQRVWLMRTLNKDKRQPHYNVVMKHDTELSPRLVTAVNNLESQETLEYGSRIRLLEADLMDRNVSMISLTLDETRELFHKTAAARFEHMNRAEFISKKTYRSN